MRTAFRSRQPLAVLMLDIDHMKQINDVGGHLAGDRALAAFGQVLAEATRAADIVGRYGGDEFAVILAQTSSAAAGQVGERFLQLLQGKSVRGPLEPLPLQSSVGLCVLEPHPFTLGEHSSELTPAYFRQMSQRLLVGADEALYRAKNLGGGQVYRGAALEWLPTNANLSG